MKGQLEVSFQWIYVVLAGGAFLLMFFFAFKGCTDAGEQQVSAGSVRSAANAITSAAWQQGERNISLTADVSCIGEVITLRTDTASTQLEQAPAFLSPALKGEVFLLSKEVTIRQQGTPSIRLGNVVYGIDQNTQYYVIKDGARKYEEIVAINARNVRMIEQIDNVNIPSTSNGVVIISWSRPAIPTVPGGVPMYGVWIKSADEVEFLKVRNGQFVSTGTEQYENLELLIGAAIAGQQSTYACARQNFFGRADTIIDVYRARNALLIPRVDPACRSVLSQANTILAGTVSSILTSNIMTHQSTLNGLGCPVVA